MMVVLAPPDKPMILRGPMFHGVVRQFLTDVQLGELDYLIVDIYQEQAMFNFRSPNLVLCKGSGFGLQLANV